MAARPPVTAIVPFAGSQAELERCLDALAGLRLAPGDRVLVADNRAEPRPERRATVEVIDASGPPSSYHARAAAAARAGDAEWLVFLDADTVPEPDLLDRYFDPPPRERTAVLAGGIDDWVEEDTLVARYIAARRKLDQGTTLAHPHGPYAQTANCAVRRSAFEAVGGFPDPVFSGGDADLCWRLREAGWELEERAAARVRHRNRATLTALLGQLHRHGAGMQWLDRRRPGAFPPPTSRELAGRCAHCLRELHAGGGAYALLDFLSLWARDFGRLHANGVPRRV